MGMALASILAPGTDAVRLIDARHPTTAPAVPIILSDATRLTDAAAAATAGATAVVLALPYAAARDAITEIAPHMPPGALLVETLSVKHGPASWRQGLRDDLEYLGINPLFGPDLQWSGRPVLMVPYRAGPLAFAFTALIARTGALTIEVDADAHDRELAERQLACHALALALGAVLAQPTDNRLPLLEGPPPYQTHLMVLARMLQGNPEVYSEIQSQNPYGAAIRQRLIAALQALSGPEDEVTAMVETMQRKLVDALDPAAAACGRLFATRLFKD
jgi:prephenate dehydrogenase